MLQQYHQQPDPELVSKTIAFVNTTTIPAKQLTPLLLGFYGALCHQNAALAQNLQNQLKDIKQPTYQQLLRDAVRINLDSLYAQAPPSPGLNDMNWSSFFATGDPRYLENLLRVTQYYPERKNLTLFVTAGSAMWSLAANAGQDQAVRAYLTASKHPNAVQILQNGSEYYRNQMPMIIRQNKGGWDPATYPPQ